MRRPSLLTIRIILVVVSPFVFAWAFISTFLRELVDCCWFAWNAVMQEIECFRTYWQTGIPTPTQGPTMTRPVCDDQPQPRRDDNASPR